MPHATPRLFILRHGETEWSLSGKHTGTTDIPLTSNGEARSIATGKALVGEDRLIVRSNVAAVYVSPRHRAQRTLELLMGGDDTVEFMPEGVEDGYLKENGRGCGIDNDGHGKLLARVTKDLREWDYGDYEGRTSKEIAAERRQNGLPAWEIWRDGCPGGESPQDVTSRLDFVIDHIRKLYHEPAFQDTAHDNKPRPCDVVVVAHGHILRALAARWVGRDIHDNPNLILEAGGVGTLSYEHNSINEPAILLGGSFVVNVAESAKRDQAEKDAKKDFTS